MLFPHVLLDGLEGRMECGSIRAALSPAVHSVGAAPQPPEGPQCIVVAQLDVPPGGGGLEVEDVAQLPVASDEGGGQAGAVGAGDAHTLQVHTDQLFCAHLLGQRGGHIVPVAAVEVRHPVDGVGPQGGEAGCRGQQVVFHLDLGDVFQRKLPGLESLLLHGHEAQPDGAFAEFIFVQHPLDDLFQRSDVHAALSHSVFEECVQLGKRRILGGQLHHILAADGQPHVPGRLVEVEGEHGAVQAADAGTRNDLGPPAQLDQRPPDAHLIAAAGAPARQHQPLYGGVVLRHVFCLL